MKKRLLACLLAMLLCFGLPVNAVALDLSITQQGEVQKGQILEYEVTVTELTIANSGSILVKYNADVFALVETEWHIPSAMMAAFDPKNNVAVFACKDPVSISGLIFTIKLQVKENAAYGDATVSFDTAFKNTNNAADNVEIKDTESDTFVSCMNHQPGAAATCTTGQLCSVCQFELAPATGHDFSKKDGDESGHWTICSVCGEVEEDSKGYHVSIDENIANCQRPSICNVCEMSFGQVDPENHTGNTVVVGAAAASCAANGYTGDIHCQDCDALLSKGSVIPATGDHVDADGNWETDAENHYHTCACGYIFDITAHSGGTATCTEKAECQECGQAYGEVDAENHTGGTYTVGQKDATCYAEGYTGDVKCNSCKAVLDFGEGIPMIAHKVTDSWKSDENGHWKNCQTPGCEFFESAMDYEAHSGGEATCTRKAVCDVCKAQYGSVNGDKHLNTELRGAKAATEDSEGYTGDTFCLDCQKVIVEGSVIAKLPHTHNMKFVAAKAASCTAEGNIAYWNCTKCGKYYSDNSGAKEISLADTVIAKLAHNYTVLKYDANNHWYQCASCSAANGREAHKGGTATCLDKAVCSVCNQAYGALAEHSYAEVAAAEYLKTKADCVNAAVYYKSCSVCKIASRETFTYGDADAENHIGDTYLEGAKEATCTEDGYTGDTICQSCKAKLTEGQIIPKAHSLEEIAAVDATHEQAGNIRYFRCGVCGKLYADEKAETEIALEDTVIAKGEHSYGEKYEYDEKNHWKACECGQIVDKEAHKFGEWVITKEAGKNQKGMKQKTCEGCGYIVTEEIPALESVTPNTGDMSNVVLWAFIMVLSGCCLVYVTVLSKKRNQW